MQKIMDITEALRKLDAKRVLRDHAVDDSRFSAFAGFPPHKRMDGKEFEHFITSWLGRISRYYDVEKYDVSVQVFDNIAVATGYERWSMVYDGKPLSSVERFTMVFLRRNGNWNVIHEHFTVMPQA